MTITDRGLLGRKEQDLKLPPHWLMLSEQRHQ